MNITDALKNDNFDIRLSCGDTWMYWDEADQEWVVMRHPYGAKKNRIIYHGQSEDNAIKALTELD